MSLFQPRTNYYESNAITRDIVHLGAHGCDAIFTSYQADTLYSSLINIAKTRHIVIHGCVKLSIKGQNILYRAGDSFEIPAETEHGVHYISDCSIIEFWFERNRA